MTRSGGPPPRRSRARTRAAIASRAAAGDRPADAHQQPGGVVDRGDGVDGVGRRRAPPPTRSPNAESAQRPFVMRFARVPLALAREQHEGQVGARPGLGRYQAGGSTASGSIRSMSTHLAAEVARPRRRRRARGPGRRRPRRRGRRARGRRRSSSPAPSSASRATGPSGRISTATAPSRFSAATTDQARSGGCSSARRRARPGARRATSRPRTTLSMRRLTASCG